MKTLQQLRDDRNALEAQVKTLLAAADDEADGILSPEQQEQIAEAETKIEALTKTIDARTRHESREAALAQSAGRRTQAQEPGAGATVIEVGDELLDPACGYAYPAQFALDVHRACTTQQRPQRLSAAMDIARKLDLASGIEAAPSSYHQEAVGADGGYMVPPAFSAEIWDGVYSPDDEDLINWITPEPTQSNVVGMLRDEWTPWGSSGVLSYWRAEASQMSATKSALKTVQMPLHELYAFVLATDELLSDAPRLNARLTKQAAAAIKYKASDALMYGTGAGVPLGWTAGGSIVSVAKETSQTADTINAANVTKMYGRLLGLNSRCFWVINGDAYNQIPQMTIGYQPVWTPPAQGLKGAPTGTLLGLPVYVNEHCQTLGDLYDIQLINPDGYYCAVKQGGVQAASSMHLYFDYAITAFRWTFRIGGQPIMSTYVTPDNGTSYRSHFVALAERA